MKTFLPFVAALFLSNCGVAYHSSSVSPGISSSGSKVRVIPLTAETVLVANRSAYSPKQLPAAFFASAGAPGGLRVPNAAVEPAYRPETRPGPVQTRLPPPPAQTPYRIGIADTLLLATPSGSSSVEQLSGLLAAQNRRQGYSVQDDGSISIPDVGRVLVAGKSLEEAESAVFNSLVEAGINPAFSLEISEFNSQRVSIGGAVNNPTVVPLSLSPLRLNQAVNAAGGFSLSDLDYASIRIYRDGTLYQIPVKDYYSKGALQNTLLADGDSVFVDTAFDLDKATLYFEQQIKLTEFRQAARQTALAELELEAKLRRAELGERRGNFEDRIALDAVERDYVYILGEVGRQSRFPLPFEHKATLADALYSEATGYSNRTGDPRHVYVLRSSPDPAAFSGMTAWNLDARNAANFVLATRLELRPNDVVFVAEQPITRWNRVLTQLGPSIVTSSVAAAN
ncbi:polysaccharide biosynthesis/export family protein [Pseudophaeobacter sp.]|uniref:polysaccharide biosynthesis/export family protein n=1 Tax=Pseudophaeobacter sp. TaxID=1971739 RepID=UPI002605156F|nr:polysaccharide biosynthesis/export family protein [Pseudophaeobacter sp.]